MKVVESLGWYFPQSTGGTEVYVSSLCRELQRLGVSVVIAAAMDDGPEHHYLHEEIPVYRYPVLAQRDEAQAAGIRPHGGFDKFRQWLQDEQPDIYHQHSWTYGCGLHHLRAARELGITTLLTVHVPNAVCPRGTMLKQGREACDGVISQQRCASCWLQARGMASTPSRLLTRIPPALGRRARSLGRVGTALAATAIVEQHLQSLLEAAQTADRVIAVCQWLYDALLANGVPRDKLVLNRQGVSVGALPAPRPERAPGPLRLGYLGRWDPAKGIDILVQALLKLPSEVEVELLVRAVEPHDTAMREHMLAVCRMAETDPRIRMLGPLAPDQVPDFLRNLDALAVPSQWLETGPLVVLESFAAGTPVLGSDLGGIRELVHDGHDGLLVAHDDVDAWAQAMHTMADSKNLLIRLSSGIVHPRLMSESSAEIHQLYQELTRK